MTISSSFMEGGAMRATLTLCVALVLLVAPARADVADLWDLKPGKVELKSAGPLVFGPDGVLFVGDTLAATIYAIDTNDGKGNPAKVKYDIAELGKKVGKALGAESRVRIRDLAVHPGTGSIFLTVTAGRKPALVKVSSAGKVSKISLAKIAHSKVALPNTPDDKVVRGFRGSYNLRRNSITDMAYSNSKLLVAGAGKKMTKGRRKRSLAYVREISFPFKKGDDGTNIQIYHGAHGKSENYATVQTLVPFTIGGEPSLLAGFTCTPLVKFPIKALSKEKAVGTTIAELGNRNRPLDMIVYEKDGKTFLLMANSARGVMKISTEGIERKNGLNSRVPRGETAGQKYETIKKLKGVVQLDKLNDSSAVILVRSSAGMHLKTIGLP